MSFNPPVIDWGQLAPIVVMLGAGVLGVLVETFVPRKPRRIVQIAIALIATLVAFAWAGRNFATAIAHDGKIPSDQTLAAVSLPAAVFALQAIIALLAFLALLVIADRTADGETPFTPQAASVPGSEYEEQARRAGLIQSEVFPLVMFATGGMMLFCAAGDLLTMFVALEVLSLPLYLLSAIARRRRLLSLEAALKYFLLGAFASAFFLFGTALIYGATGTVSLSGVAQFIQTGNAAMDPILLAGVIMVVAGLLFKVGAVPFHSWTPDVYQGAPTPITGFMAACTKVAAFGALLRVVYVMLPYLTWDLRPVLWTVAIATMAIGTIVAVVQTDIKRMLAYSSIAHAGFILTGIVALDSRGISAVLFYLLAYGLVTVGAFAVVSLVRQTNPDGEIIGEATHISQWAGLGKRSPILAGVFAFMLLCFAGIPLTSGFVGKFTVFSAAWAGGAWPLVVVGVVASAIAAFFYARIIVLMFFTEPAMDSAVVVQTQGLTQITIAVTTTLTLVLGLYPAPILDLADKAAKLLF